MEELKTSEHSGEKAKLKKENSFCLKVYQTTRQITKCHNGFPGTCNPRSLMCKTNYFHPKRLVTLFCRYQILPVKLVRMLR